MVMSDCTESFDKIPLFNYFVPSWQHSVSC